MSEKLPKSIYLAGKISKNDWRHNVVPGLRAAWCSDGEEPVLPWPVLPDVIGGYLDYTGPYPASCDHGCWHTDSTHGAAGDDYESAFGRHQGFGGGCGGGCGGAYPALTRDQVRACCLDAIQRSDLVFAWIDDLTAYGTIAEIGYAHALGKAIIIASPQPPDFSPSHDDHGLTDLWFAFSLATQVVQRTDPAVAVLSLADTLRTAVTVKMPSLPASASPIERQFWEAHLRLALPALHGLIYNHHVMRYKVDFALPSLKKGIELDGYAFQYHGHRERPPSAAHARVPGLAHHPVRRPGNSPGCRGLRAPGRCTARA